MGYEHGKGLGKTKQGIVEPVQAMARPGRGAVGAYGSEAKGPKFGGDPCLGRKFKILLFKNLPRKRSHGLIYQRTSWNQK